MKHVTLTISAGQHTRRNCPIWVDLPPQILDEGSGPVVTDEGGTVIPSQVLPGQPAAICLMLDTLPKGTSKTFTVKAGEPPVAPSVRLSKTPADKIDVEIGGTLFTSYHYAQKWARPFLMPIVGPHGDWITRSYADDEIEKNEDYPHHKSLWVAWGDVNGSDQWSEMEGHGRQVHQTFEAVESGPAFGRIVALNHWVTNDGRKILEERRSLVFYNTPATARLMDLSVTFVATEGPVTFGDTKEGGIASVRMAPSMTDEASTIVNSYGGVREAETWGKRAHWCDYVGPVDGKTVGIAILDSPDNFRYPTYWHVRDYGLMTANPFGLSHFTDDTTRDGSHTMQKGSTLSFQYRFYFHDGDTGSADVAGRFLDHVAPPTVEIR